MEQRREFLAASAHYHDVYLNECQLYEDAYSHSMERLSRPLPATSTPEDYARQVAECKTHREEMEDKYRQLNFLYEKLDRDTRSRSTRQYHDLEKRSNDLQEKFLEQIYRSEYFLRVWKEYQVRLEDFHRQLEEMEKQSVTRPKRSIAFAQIQSTYLLYKDFKQRLTFIEPELYHLSDEIQKLCQELPVLSLQTSLQTAKENFSRLTNEIGEKFDCHKNATVLANEIKRNLAILEETLGQCSSAASGQLTGDTNELKIQLERLMV